MGKWIFESDFKGKKWKFLQLQVLSMLGVKEKNTKTNKIIIVKNRKLATQNFLFNMHINFPFSNIKRLSFLWKICLNMILWNIGIVCFIIELHQFTSGTSYIPQKRKQNLQIWSLYHSRGRIVAASRPLQIYTESANPNWAALSWVFFATLWFSLWILDKVIKM
jgi:hypothetical protein